MKLPKSINTALAAAAPIYLGSTNDRNGITLMPGSDLTINEYGADVLVRNYRLRTTLATSVYKDLQRGIADDIYPMLRLSTVRVLDEEGMMSTLRCEFKGLTGWNSPILQSNGRSLQTSSYTFLRGGGNRDVVISFSYNAPYTRYRWCQTTSNYTPKKSVNKSLSLKSDLVSMEADLRQSGINSALTKDLVNKALSQPTTVIIAGENSEEVVPGYLWEIECVAMRVVTPTNLVIVDA